MISMTGSERIRYEPRNCIGGCLSKATDRCESEVKWEETSAGSNRDQNSKGINSTVKRTRGYVNELLSSAVLLVTTDTKVTQREPHNYGHQTIPFLILSFLPGIWSEYQPNSRGSGIINKLAQGEDTGPSDHENIWNLQEIFSSYLWSWGNKSSRWRTYWFQGHMARQNPEHHTSFLSIWLIQSQHNVLWSTHC